MASLPTEEAESIGRLSTLILLALVIGIAGVVFIMWVMQVWRRSLKRNGKRRQDTADGADPWQLAAKRLKANDDTAEERPSNGP